MWRLTADALREGVKSTTRYRSKAPNKRSSRGQPLPQRQASGAKGGHAARRAANLKRSRRAEEAWRNDPRSNPYSCGSSAEFEVGYSTDAPFPVRADSPYSQYNGDLAFNTPYHGSKQTDFSPMLGVPRQLVSPSRDYASTSLSPNIPMCGAVGDAAYVLEHHPVEPMFIGSPTPSGDDPLTPKDRRAVWDEDVVMGVDVYDETSYNGSGS
jgi:hypothetical protein